jgi:hypothetical protein
MPRGPGGGRDGDDVYHENDRGLEARGVRTAR